MELSVYSPVPEQSKAPFAVPMVEGKTHHLSLVVVDEFLKEESSFAVEREEEMVSLVEGKPTLRIGRFLKPFVDHVNQAAEIPPVPLLSEIITFKPCKWPPKILFKGWRCPQKKWKYWIDRLQPLYGPIWVKAGIYNGIMASTYRVRKDHDLVLALLEKWCPQTSSFVFPWGEATITLEDTFILGGFSFLGKPITEPLTKDQEKLEKKMEEEHDGFYRHQWWNPSNSEWINHFTETQIDLEHVAFISLWLLRYVFPTPSERAAGRYVFPIAVHLAQGTPIALGPAVLASLYRDLRFLKEQCVQSLLGPKKDFLEDDFHLNVYAPFQLMQLWAWERFPTLRPEKPNSLRPGEPRAALWSKLRTNISIELVKLVMSSPESYQWRPYTTNLSNWCLPPFYSEKEKWVSQGSDGEDELQSFSHFLWASQLVGIDSKEHYLPHRVAMQFGFDQDIPGHLSFPRRYCSQPLKFAMFSVPPRHFKSDVTKRYSEWWKQSMLLRREAIKCALTQVQIQENTRKLAKRKRSMKDKARSNNCLALTLVSSDNHKRNFENSTDENLQLEKVKDEDPYGPVPPGFSSKCNKLHLEDSSQKEEDSVLQKFKLLKDLNESAIVSIPAIASITPRKRDLAGTEGALIDLTEKNSIKDKGGHRPKVGGIKRKAMELEARVWELEREISGLKEKLRSKEAGIQTKPSPSLSV